MRHAHLAILGTALLASCQSLIGYEEKDFISGDGDGDDEQGGQGGMNPSSGGSASGGEGPGGGNGSGGLNLGGDLGVGGKGSGGDGTGGEGTGGEGTGGDPEPGFVPSSCVELSAECGSGIEPCCGVVQVAAGAGTQGRVGAGSDHEPERTVTVSEFYIDQFEVTVGRFRAFEDAYADWRSEGHPLEDEGAHPSVPGSGWRSGWSAELPASLPSDDNLCHFDWATRGAFGTEVLPMNCLNWYEAYAFCIWDGGRLPTEAEWEYVASGQGDDRPLPWGNAPAVEGVHAAFNCFVSGDCQEPTKNINDFVTVGALTTGFGVGGVGEMAGNVGEWVRDAYYNIEYFETGDCTDCLRLETDDVAVPRILRGGNMLSTEQEIRTYVRFSLDPLDHYPVAGVRCAYDL